MRYLNCFKKVKVIWGATALEGRLCSSDYGLHGASFVLRGNTHELIEELDSYPEGLAEKLQTFWYV
jgi:hypothetical protein